MSLLAALTLPLLASAACASTPCYTPSSSTFNATDFTTWLAAQTAATLNIAPGTYLLPYLPSTRAHLSFPPLASTTLDFSGVTLVASNRTRAGLYIPSWTQSALVGLSLRYEQPPSNTARVTAVGALSVDVAVEAGHPTDDFDSGLLASCNVFSAATRLRKPLSFDVYVASVAPLAGGLFRLTVANRGQLAGVAPGDLLGCRVVYGEMTVTVDNCTESALRGVTLYGGPVFGILEAGGDANEYTDVTIALPAPPPGAATQPLLSTSADGLHSANARRGPRITRANFTGMDDDGIAIHGQFRLVTGADAATVTLVSLGPLRVGDHIFFYNTTFGPLPAVAGPAFAPTPFVVTAFAAAPRSYVPPFNVSKTMPSQVLPGAQFVIVTLSPPPPAGVMFDCVAVNADAVGAGFFIRDSTIANHRARGMLIKATDGIIANNSITNSSLGGMIVTPELYWREAGYARNITIVNNTIDLSSSGSQSYGGIALGAVAPNGQLALSPGASAITIENNVLIGAGYNPIWLNAAGNVTLRGNRLVSPFASTNASDLPSCCLPLPAARVAVYVQSVQGVTVEGNCVARAPGGDSLSALLNVVDSTGTWEGGVALC